MNKQEILNEIEKTKEHLANMEKMLEECEYKRWKPKDGQEYYYIDDAGLKIYAGKNLGYLIDKRAIEAYNCFKTKKEAEIEVEKILIRRKLEDIARRLLYVNCPPIDKLHTNRKRYHPNFDRFIPLAKEVFTQHRNQHGIPASEALWGILEQQGAGCNITIDDEFLLLLFCTVLAVWTNDLEIQPYHWQYMVNTYKEMKALSLDVIKDNTSSYEKICVFMREYAEQKSKSKGKVPLIEIKDYCVRERIISEVRFKKWFNEICEEFVKTNSGKYIIEKNQMYAWLTENFAYNG